MRIILFAILSLAFTNSFGQNSRGQLLPYKSSYKWGYINFSGDIVIPATFDIAANFEENFAIVKIGEKTGMISSSGKQLIPCIYRNVDILGSNLIAVKENTLWGLVDSANVVLLPQEYESIELLNSYSVRLKKNSRFGLYHSINKKILPCEFDTLSLAQLGFFRLTLQNKFGMADTSHTVIVDPIFDDIKVEKPALLLRMNGLWAVCNKAGRMGSEAIWKNYKIVSDDFMMFQNDANLWALYSSEDNHVVTKPGFADFDVLTKNLIVTVANKKQGLINKHGKSLLEPLYDEFAVKENLILVRSGQKWGIADVNGKMLHEPSWKNIGAFKDNVAIVASESNALGIINIKGKVLAEAGYSFIEYSDLSVKCYADGGMDLITYDEQGNFTDKTTYKNVRTLQVGSNYFDNGLSNSNNGIRLVFANTDTFSLSLRIAPYSCPPNVRMKSPIANNVYDIRVRFGVYDRRRKKLIVKVEKWDIMLDDFRSGPVARIIEEGGRFGIMDRRGNSKMDFTITKNGKPARVKISYIGNFSEDLARINLGGALGGKASTPLSNPYRSLILYRLSCTGGQWGFINRQGQLAITPQYEYVDDFQNGRAIVKMNGKYGVINIRNEFVIKPEYDLIEFLPNTQNNFYVIYLNSPRYGVIDDNGKILVPAKYENLGNWQEGLTSFRSGKKFGFINIDGSIAIPAEYDKVKEFSDGFAAVQKDKKWGYIDHSGSFIIQPAFSSAGSFQNNFAPVTSLKGNGYVNKNGDVRYSKYSKCFEYNKGLAKIKVKGRYGYIDEKGSWVVHPHYSEISDFNQYNLAIVRKRRKYGIIDKTGHHVTHINLQRVNKFSEGYAAIQKKNKYGFIDSTGKVVIEPQYLNVGKFSEGMAAVSIKGRWGYIDNANKIIIEPKYKKGGEFVENMAAVRDDRLWGYINKTGKEVIDLKYGNSSDFKDGIAIVTGGDNSGAYFISQEGKILFESTFEKAFQFEGSIARVRKYGNWGLINKDGANLIDYKYSRIDPFLGQKAVVMVLGVKGIADLEGKIIAEPEYQRIKYEKGFFCLEKSDEVGYLKTDGSWLLSLQK